MFEALYLFNYLCSKPETVMLHWTMKVNVYGMARL